ncbi:MAG TPA: response regulator [Gammaproteobacteria bacterium]
MSDSTSTRPRLLVVDDSRLIRASFVKFLGEEFDIEQCEDGAQAWELLQQDQSFNLIFSDLSMPNLDGYQFLEKIRGSDNPEIAEMPVIIVTGKEDGEEAKERFLSLGATDLVSKPFHSAELVSRARGYAALRKKVVQLEKQVPVDKLTGLSTREYFMEQGEKHLALARRNYYRLTVARITIANLAQLKNDFGPQVAAKMIAVAGKALADNKRTEDVAAHFGTGQFALLLPGTDPQATAQVWARLRNRIANFQLKVGERLAQISFATGLSSQNIDESITQFSQMLYQAEEALRKPAPATEAVPAMAPGPVPDEEPAAATPPPVEAAAHAQVSVDALLGQLKRREAPSTPQLVAALRSLLPLLTLANRQFKLDIDNALETISEEVVKK